MDLWNNDKPVSDYGIDVPPWIEPDITVSDVADEHDGLAEPLRDFARWIYRQLEREYDYLTSDEAVRESLEANECEFTADGDLA